MLPRFEIGVVCRQSRNSAEARTSELGNPTTMDLAFVIFVRPPSAGMWPQIIWHQINFATILPHLSALLEKLKGGSISLLIVRMTV